MSKDTEKIDEVLLKIEKAQQAWDDIGGRTFNVGTKILYDGKFGVVTDLNQGSEDPSGSTVDLRLSDGATMEGVSVTTKALQFYRA